MTAPHSANSANGTLNGMVSEVLPKTFTTATQGSLCQGFSNLLGLLSSYELFKIIHNCTDAQVCQISKQRSFNMGKKQDKALPVTGH
jgi:hypothetical protein